MKVVLRSVHIQLSLKLEEYIGKVSTDTNGRLEVFSTLWVLGPTVTIFELKETFTLIYQNFKKGQKKMNKLIWS